MLVWSMSIREDFDLYGLPDTEQYVEVLSSEFGASRHPNQENAFILEQHPFYAPRPVEDHISTPGFNNIPLPDSPDPSTREPSGIFPDDILSRWTQEQDLIFEATLRELRGYRPKK